jgi:hypothetical protein
MGYGKTVAKIQDKNHSGLFSTHWGDENWQKCSEQKRRELEREKHITTTRTHTILQQLFKLVHHEYDEPIGCLLA